MDPRNGPPGDDERNEQEETADPEFPPMPQAPDAPPIPDVLLKPATSTRSRSTGSGSSSPLTDVTKAWSVALDFVFTVLGALLLGYFGDRWFQTSPKLTIGGLVVGFGFALWRIIRRTLADERAEQEARKKSGSGPR